MVPVVFVSNQPIDYEARGSKARFIDKLVSSILVKVN
jgi:hypothetical protein